MGSRGDANWTSHPPSPHPSTAALLRPEKLNRSSLRQSFQALEVAAALDRPTQRVVVIVTSQLADILHSKRAKQPSAYLPLRLNLRQLVAFMCFFPRPPNKTNAEGCRANFQMGSEQTAADRVLFAAHNYDNEKQLSPGASNSTPDVQGRLGS